MLQIATTKNICLFVICLVLFSGCVSSDNRRGFSQNQLSSVRLKNLKQFEGTYMNKPQGNGPSLSSIVFQTYLPNVDAVSCKVLGANQIQVEAISSNLVIKTKTLTLNKDFTMSSSKIPTESKTKSVTYHGGDVSLMPPFAGVFHISGDLFLNSNGDVVYRESSKIAILALYVVPVAGSTEDYSLYKKVK
jgi:hypothetical protein